MKIYNFGQLIGRAFACGLLLACHTTTAVAQPPGTSRRIGVILALTGPIGSVGTSIKNAILVAAEQFDTANSVEFIFEDDQFQAKHAVSAAEKFISQDRVDALITFSAATSSAVSEIAERRKVPLVGITALSGIGKSRTYVKSIFLATDQQVGLLWSAADASGFKRIAMITSIQESMLEFHKKFKEKDPSRIVREDEITQGDINLGSTVTRILSQRPDAVTLFLLPPQISAAGRLLRDQGFRGQFIGAPPLYNPPEIQSSHGALTGAWLPGPSSRGSSEFLKLYESRFGEPCISEGLYGYDAAALLIESAKSGDIAEHLNRIKTFKGLLGYYPKSVENAFQVPAELKTIGADGSLQTRNK